MKKQSSFSKTSFIIFSLCSLVLTITAYSGLFKTFYQQDEWAGLGLFLSNGLSGNLKGETWFQLLLGTGRPLTVPILYIFFRIFPFQVWPFALFSIIMHAANGILVFGIVSLLTGNLIAAWVAGMFFVASYNGIQALSWFATSPPTLASSFLSLFSILLTVMYIRKNKNIYVVWAQLCLIMSYYLKELSISLVIFLPVLLLLLNRGKLKLRKIIKLFLPLILFFSIIVFVNIIQFMQPSTQVGAFVGQSSGGVVQISKNVIFYPVISFSQVFIPYPLVVKISPSLGLISHYTDTLFLSVSIILLIGIAITAVILKDKRNVIFAGTFLILCSFLPYAVLIRGSSYLDSRYFYFSMAGGGILLGIYTDIFLSKLKSTSAFIRRSVVSLILLICLGYLYKNIQFIRRDVGGQIVVAEERQSVIKQVLTIIPMPPKNPIFYISGNVENFYLIPNQHLPFQQGIGYTLMCMYYKSGKVSPALLSQKDAFLWGVNQQGYREVNGMGFGYFTDTHALIDLFKHNSLLKTDQIIALSYFGDIHIVRDISNDIRGVVREQLSKEY